ncbi:MAG: MBL fold metallo-hydrolase [Gemmatimonadales bacterium]|nr:MBL fold metallo-hydrolase [Gemmatimonadales bacterium]
MRLVLLGTGTSFGVPQLGCDCAVCRSTDPRDRRTRSSALIEAGDSRILIDTAPELRLQLLAAGARRLDAVLMSHEHADHVAGIDDLRAFTGGGRPPLPLYGSERVVEFLRGAYRYIFDERAEPHAGTSKPKLTLTPVEPDRAVTIAGREVLPLAFEHGHAVVLGFRIGPVAYVTDAKRVSAEAIRALQGLEVLVLNALWWRPHPTHQSIPEAVEAARAIGARRTILTHLTHETAHAELAARLPAGIEPGYDGLTLEVSE